MRRLSFASTSVLVVLWLSVGFFTYASYRARFFSGHPSWSFVEAVGQYTQGMVMLWGPFVLMSVLILMRKDSVAINAIAVFLAATALIASYYTDTTTGTLLFLNVVLSWVCSLVAIPIALAIASGTSAAGSRPANNTVDPDARKDGARRSP